MSKQQTHIAQVQKEYHITENQLNRIKNLMDFARKQLKCGADYDSCMFERDMLAIVKNPEYQYMYDHHMVTDIAEAFAQDYRWEEVFFTLYKDDITLKSTIDKLLEEHRI